MRPARRRLPLLLSALFLLILPPTLVWSASNRDVLWETVTNCLDLTALDYCRQCKLPRTEKICPQVSGCGKTLEVWGESANYVAVRDRKMCDCPTGFVHGLVLPRARVTGVEDPRRPSGIWSFAWGVARTRIADDNRIALYVNAQRVRSQDQLHVHMVRLRGDARERFARLKVSRVPSLDDVWSAARLSAGASGLVDYSVLVATHPDGGFLVLVQKGSPREYAEATCQPDGEE